MQRMRQWIRVLGGLLRPGLRHGRSKFIRARGRVDHVIILDGTMSSLLRGCESNAGLAYRLISERSGAGMTVYYEAGLQWVDWRATLDILTGCGINRQIRRAYGYLSSRYREGDRIFLLGYSRGAYAVRSLAGVIDQIGLLKPENATERNVMTAYRHYRATPAGTAAAEFSARYCHETLPIEMIGVWDTVKALGMRLPVFWRWTPDTHAFHNHSLGNAIRHGFHALAFDETRAVFTPVLWESRPDHDGHLEQVWFRGTHGDVGGQLGGYEPARPLANVSLVWMLERAAACGLPLPEGWRARFPADPDAQSVGTWRGWGKMFLIRAPRTVGTDPSERLHESVRDPSRRRGGRRRTA